MRKYIGKIIIICIFIFSNNLFAKDWVFLVSNEDPSMVFYRGLIRSSDATLTSFLDHITGRSCTDSEYGVSRSVYISFTGDQSLANQIARERATTTGINFYVYRVRGDNTIYNSLTTALYQFNQLPSAGPIPDNLVTTLRNEDEYISVLPSIPVAQIQSANIFYADSIVPARHVLNDNFGWGLDSQTNSSPYTGSGSTINNIDVTNNRTAPTYWNRALTSVSACFQNMICRSGRIYGLEQANNSVPVFSREPEHNHTNRVSDIEIEIDCTMVNPAAAVTAIIQTSQHIEHTEL